MEHILATVFLTFTTQDSPSQGLDTVDLMPSHRDRVAIAPTSGQKAGGRRHAFALVVNNKGGGHGEIGLHLALALRAKGLEVQVCAPSSIAGLVILATCEHIRPTKMFGS